MIQEETGGITAAEGFTAAGIHCGIRHNKVKKDLALIVSQVPAVCDGLFTRNRVKAAPVKLDMATLKQSDTIQAIIANSGIANACAPGCQEAAEGMQKMAADALGIDPSQVLVSSTGVIGIPLELEPIKEDMPELLAALTDQPSGSDDAAHAIMTTDTVKKEYAVSLVLGGQKVTIGAIAKGSGMIHPNMGTMLCYITTDCAITKTMLHQALKHVCDLTFNRISVDGDTSTNDSLIMMANGMAHNPLIDTDNDDFKAFQDALQSLCTTMARRMAKDGEGAKHLITCTVSEAASETEAETLSKSIISSTLTKAAIFGCDANWGRVLCAMGYAGVPFDPDTVDISFASKAGEIPVCEKGCGLAFDEDLAKKILSQDEIEILVDMHEGSAQATCWGCDITYDYIRINGDYRT
jgi:glutamate N-acetyltransferase/amino-acid N-acetyltransferase